MIEDIHQYGIEYVLIGLGIFLVVKEFNRVVVKIDELIEAVNHVKEAYIRLETTLEDHEKRIERLEK